MNDGRFDNYNEKALEVIEKSKKISKRLESGYIGTEHILLALASVGESIAYKVLSSEGVTYKKLLKILKDKYLIESSGDSVITFSARANKILSESSEIARTYGVDLLGTEHILLAILKERSGVADRILSDLDIEKNTLIKAIEKIVGPLMHFGNIPIDNDAESDGSALDKYCKDYTLMAYERKFDPVIGRKSELGRIAQILTRRTKNNPLLVGDPGVGKTAIIEAFASNIVSGAVPEQLENKRLLALDLTAMLAGTRYRGDFEERIKNVLEEIVSSGDVILFVDEIHTLIGAGSGEGSLDASNIIKPYLARGEIKLIGATTNSEFKKYLSKDKALERRMQKISVEETTDVETLEILKGLRKIFEKHYKLRITDSALEQAVYLSKRYITDRFLPDKAIDTLDEACSKSKLGLSILPDKILKIKNELDLVIRERNELMKNLDIERLNEINKLELDLDKKYEAAYRRWKRANSKKEIVVDDSDIEIIISDQTGVPITKLNQSESQKLNNLSKELKKRVIGQDEAVEVLSRAIKRGRLGLADPDKPLGSFLFLGPTGVGKTELSKALAISLFGEEKALIRLDMSEYMEKHSVSKIIGSPPGYVGFEEGGGLSEQVKKKPYSVVLFDEIEKAHPDVFNILLQILDDGHITDSSGVKIDFKNTVIIMTGNVGARTIVSNKQLGFTANNEKKIDYATMKKNVMDESKKLFKPEFLNRIDEFVVFKSLDRKDMISIVDITFEELKERVKQEVGIYVSLTFAAKKYLADKGFDEVYGARPVKRAMVNLVQDKLTDLILSGEFKSGDKITIGYKKGSLSFSKK